MRLMYSWLVALAVTAIAVTIAYYWLDRPIALIIHNQFNSTDHPIFVVLNQIPDPRTLIVIAVSLGLGFRALSGRSISNFYAAVFLCSWSLFLSEAIKNQLKVVFGRTWPETWVDNNPSFIRDGVFGFNFMRDGDAFRSFPSGHMAAICAVMSVLWFWYPRWRVLFAIMALFVGVGLVGANYHFLSDVIAGAFVGISTGMMAVAIWHLRIGLAGEDLG